MNFHFDAELWWP